MKKKILICLVLISVITLLLSTAISGIVYRKAFSKQVETDLERLVSVMSAYEDESDFIEHLREHTAGNNMENNEHLRITLIDSKGEILYESDPTVQLENHTDRPEVIAALENGSGHSLRMSASVGYDTYYYAFRLDNGTILRAAMRTSGMYMFYNRSIMLTTGLGCLILLLSLVLSRVLTAKLVAPIENMDMHVDENDIEAPYPELKPFVDKFKHDRDIKRNMEQLRQEFTANVSHELKTPLTSISGYAEMIEMGLAKAEDVPNFASKIRIEALRLLSLIGDIIQLSELDSLSGRDDFEEVNLLETAKAAESYLSMSAEKYGVYLNVCGEPLIVNGSRSRLEELIYNLCDNAIRYNRIDGAVCISVKRINEAPAVVVSDTGIGIPSDKKERIFERFYRIDKGRSKKTGGTGLGLAIVKHIAMLHNAEISVESELGVGTKITVLFSSNSD